MRMTAFTYNARFDGRDEPDDRRAQAQIIGLRLSLAVHATSYEVIRAPVTDTASDR